MKTKYISIVTIVLCLFVSTPNANAGFLKGLFKAVVGAAVGLAENKAGQNLNEEQKETLHNISNSFTSELEINNSYVDAGRNWAEGKKTDSFVDVGEGVLSDVGVNDNCKSFAQAALDFARIQNEYKNNIQSGMSIKEACERRYEKLKQLMIKGGSPAFEGVGNTDSYNQWVKEEKQWEEKYENGILLELKRRGYSGDEVQMYMTIIHENPGLLRGFIGDNANESDDSGLSYEERYEKYRENVNNLATTLVYDGYVQSIIKEKLDNLNIRDRSEDENFKYSDYTNSFFGSDPINMPDSKEKNNIVESPQESSPLPVVDERANVAKAITGTVLNSYALNNVELSDAQKTYLNQVADKLNKYEDIQIVIFGHTCNVGTQRANHNIGERRAKAAKNYLVSKGVSENRIQIESRDFSEPVVENDTEDHRKQNRRVTFIVK